MMILEVTYLSGESKIVEISTDEPIRDLRGKFTGAVSVVILKVS